MTSVLLKSPTSQPRRSPPRRAGTQKYLTTIVGIGESGQDSTASPSGAESHGGWTVPPTPSAPSPLVESSGVTGPQLYLRSVQSRKVSPDRPGRSVTTQDWPPGCLTLPHRCAPHELTPRWDPRDLPRWHRCALRPRGCRNTVL